MESIFPRDQIYNNSIKIWLYDDKYLFYITLKYFIESHQQFKLTFVQQILWSSARRSTCNSSVGIVLHHGVLYHLAYMGMHSPFTPVSVRRTQSVLQPEEGLRPPVQPWCWVCQIPSYLFTMASVMCELG